MIAAHIITSFIASMAFGILFYAPREAIIHCGFIGMLGWMTYLVCSWSMDPVTATLSASFAVTITGHLFAKVHRKPIIVYSISGIIPLVPGGLAYEAMRQFVQKQYPAALGTAAEAFLISGAIAVGLVASEVLNQIVKRASSEKNSLHNE
ncbi:threonine/serine exporter family protein [Paenibacillus sp. R14(2021)]|uniref:threonine/serine exporter family protein n=1 Tax=Paenibacillus sp. R14(2021) TaxID=2859228 RepID=UPI001C613A7C|nr:threonine/serine exporter family protein [Paenibacillus sp. R14(2021)]